MWTSSLALNGMVTYGKVKFNIKYYKYEFNK